MEEMMRKYAEIQSKVVIYYNIMYTHLHTLAELERERANNTQLQEQLDNVVESQREASHDNEVRVLIPRPKGTAGTNFSIQMAMGLSGSIKKYDKYKAIQV